MPRLLRGAALVAAIVLASPLASAQQPLTPAQRAEAQERFSRAITLYGQRNFEGALAEFERVYELTQRADLLFNIGRAQEALGRYPEAATSVEEYLRRTPDMAPETRAEVEQLLASVRRYIAYLRVAVTPPGAELRLDGRVLPEAQRTTDIPLSPGRHIIDARLAGHRAAQQEVVVRSGDRREVTVALEVERLDPSVLRVDGAPAGHRVFVDGALVRAPLPLPEGRHDVRVEADGRAPWSGTVVMGATGTRTLRVDLARNDQLHARWFAVTAGSAGLFFVLGGVFGGLTLAARDEFVTYFRDDPRALDVQSRGETFRTLTNVSLGIGAALGVAAVVIATRTRFGAERASTAALALAPDGIALRF